MSLALLLEGIDLALELRPRKSEKDQLVTEQCYLVWLKDTGSCRESYNRQEAPKGAAGLNQGMKIHVTWKAEAQVTSCRG